VNQMKHLDIFFSASRRSLSRFFEKRSRDDRAGRATSQKQEELKLI